MSVEADSAESTTVDSTATTDAPVETPTENSPAPNESGSEATTVEESTDTTDDTSNEGVTSEEPKKDSAESDESAEYFFNGEQVQIEVPEDLKSTLTDSGVDVDKVLGELYGKDSDFTLSDETRAPLDEKYGKPVVDTFLNALKNQNESVIKGAQEAQRAAEEANQKAVEWSNELVGGEENWTALESWATENLEESQIESFNKAMESGDKWLQELAIKDLSQKMREAEGDTSVNLISGDANSSETSGAPLNAQDYIAEMTSPEFRALRGQDKVKAQQQLDARRRAGMKRGL